MNGNLGPSRSQPAGWASIRYGSSGGDGDRKKLLTVLEHLRESAPEVLTAEAYRDFNSLYEKFQESRFYLVFLGQFKRGKTTLLNSFLGVDLLPTGVLPVTSIVTIVKFGARPRAQVYFSNGSRREIPVHDVSAYVTERGNPQNKKGVVEVEVFFPAGRLQHGVCLVDTPGIGSIFAHNTQIAYGFVPRADAAIFVFSPEAPLSQTELDFLHHLRAHVEKIFFVVNKADQVTDAERAEVLEFARETVRKQIPTGEVRFFPVSARQALAALSAQDLSSFEASLLPAFLEALDQFLASHQGALLVRSARAALQRIVRNELLGIELEEHAIALSLSELEQKIRSVEQAQESLERRYHEARLILRGEIVALQMDIEKRLNAFVQGEVPRLIGHMKKKLEENPDVPKRELTRLLDREMKLEIADIFEEWSAKEEKVVGEAFEMLASRFSREAERTIEEIQKTAAEQFGFSWTATSLPDRLTTQSEFRIKVEELMTWGLGQFPYLLPGKLFSRYLSTRLEEACQEGLCRNAGRLRSDLARGLDESLTRYLRALDQHVSDARQSVLAALQRAAQLKQASEGRSQEVRSQEACRRELLREVVRELAQIEL